MPPHCHGMGSPKCTGMAPSIIHTTTRALHGLLGQTFDTLTPDSAPKQARALLTAFDR